MNVWSSTLAKPLGADDGIAELLAPIPPDSRWPFRVVIEFGTERAELAYLTGENGRTYSIDRAVAGSERYDHPAGAEIARSVPSAALGQGGGGTGPKGDKGDKGDPGDPGLDGADGLDGPRGEDGEDGADGADGEPGANAYQVAVANGFPGNEAAWLASLVGPAGSDGADGADGLQGNQGVQGLPGPKGDKGDTGSQGPAGQNGAPGAAGTTLHSGLSDVTADQHHARDHAIGGSTHTGQLAHSALSGIGSGDHHAQAHAIGGADHSGTLAHSALGSVTADQHHTESHAARHASGQADAVSPAAIGAATSGHNHDAAYAAAAHSHALTTASGLATAETAISAAAYADVTGASVSLSAGTWLLLADCVGRGVNAAFLMNVAITDGANAIVREASQNVPASGSASVNSLGSVHLAAIVSPASTTTYKLRAARGNAAPTGSWTAVDGNAVGVANNASDNSDKGTGLIAVRIA